jgi:amino acid transporter
LLLLMVLSSAAASTQTTILPTARTVLSMGVYKAVPKIFAKTHKRFLTPTYATVIMGLVSIALYVILNYISPTNVIADSIDALGVMIAFYYGLTGFECVWFYRQSILDSVREVWQKWGLFFMIGIYTRTARNFWFRGAIPLLGSVMLWGALGYDLYYYYLPANSSSHWQIPFWPHWNMGGTFVIEAIALLVGVVLMLVYSRVAPAYFRGEVLNESTPTLVPDSIGHKVGRFGIDESEPGVQATPPGDRSASPDSTQSGSASSSSAE